jgi:hypothetical protein
MTKTEEDELAEFAKFLMEKGDVPEEPVAVTITPMAKEFRCLTCGCPFSRKDCGNDSGGVFVSIKKCPFCKSDLVVRQKESGWAAERKYDVDPAEAILGAKPNKYARMNAAKKRRGH